MSFPLSILTMKDPLYDPLRITKFDVEFLDTLRHLDAIAEANGGVRVAYSDSKSGDRLRITISAAMWMLLCRGTMPAFYKRGQEYRCSFLYTDARTGCKLPPKHIPGFDTTKLGWRDVGNGVFRVDAWTCNLCTGTARFVHPDGIEVDDDTFVMDGREYPIENVRYKTIVVETPQKHKVYIKWTCERIEDIAPIVKKASLDIMDWYINARRQYARDWRQFEMDMGHVEISLNE